MAGFILLLSYSAVQVWLLVKADQSFGDKDLRELFIKKTSFQSVSGRKEKKTNQTHPKQKRIAELIKPYFL